MEAAINQFWQSFCKENELPIDTRYIEAFHFELNEVSANELLALVLSGKKRATASSMFSWQAANTMPQVGDYSIVTDWDGIPHCVIKTTAVTILPFKDMTYDICKREGEDDCLESWKEGHTAFFTAEGRGELSYEFSEDMLVAFEDFEVVYRLK